MTQRSDDDYEDRQRQLRGDLLKLKSMARQLSTQEWLDTAFGIVERECVRREEAVIERQYEKNKAPVRILGGSVVEVREGR